MDSDKNDLSLYLASSIHEIKNAFGRYQALTEELLAQVPQEFRMPIEQQRINFEAKNIANQLTQILITYKNNEQGFLACPDDVIMEDYLEEFKARHQSSLKALNISFAIECEENLVAYIDERLITNVVDTLIYNATQAGATHIAFSSLSTKGFTRLQIEDNGPGFPEELLRDRKDIIEKKDVKETEDQTQRCIENISLTEASTGLGIYFSEKISKMHQVKNKIGYLDLGKSEQLKGACVTLFLPQ